MRKITYQTNRFDGGMTDAIRDTSNPTKFAYISHFDIYRDPNQMHVMPGFESFNGFDSDPDGIKVYDAQDIALYPSNNHLLLTKKSDGTGSKLFQMTVGETEWKLPTVYAGDTEGSHNLITRPFLYIGGSGVSANYPVDVSGFVRMGQITNSGYSATWTTDPSYTTASFTGKTNYIEDTPTGNIYFVWFNRSNISQWESSGMTWSAKTAGSVIRDISASDYTISLAGSNAEKGRNLIWDDASLLADQRNSFGSGTPYAVITPSQITAVVLSENIVGASATSGENGQSAVVIKALEGESVQTLLRIEGNRNSVNDIYSAKTSYKDAMTWYAYFATNSAGSTFENGVWAFGKGTINTQIGICKLLDTSSLGYVRQVRWIGDVCWFINHSGDGSISRLHNFDTGTYDIPAIIETLVYGSNSPYLKELNGISVVTENLPSGASVKVDYRTDTDSAWVELGTSNTTNKQKHVFTRASGTPIGRFQEIQFRITCTGKIVLKNIKIDITETEDLAF